METEHEQDATARATQRRPLVDRLGGQRRVAKVIELGALIPLVTMLIEVARGPRLQYLDYWYTLVRFTNPDGSVDPLRLVNFSNEHLVAIPSVVYWLNVVLFSGDNRTLGVFVVLMGALIVLALRTALPTSLSPVLRASLLVAASALVFSLHGMWNYLRAMSGTAWITANLIVVVALLLAVRGRWWLAWLFALLASATYGTTFAVWPVLAVLAWVRREPTWRRIVPLIVGGVIATVWLLERPSAPPGGSPASDLGTLLYNFLVVIGHLWTASNGGLAVIAGGVMLTLYAALATNPIARAPQMWFWWALALHGLLGSGMIAAARIDFGTEFGMLGRYTSLSVLMSVPLIVLLVTVIYHAKSRQASRVAVATIVAGVLGYVLGSPAAAAERAEARERQPLQAIAMRAEFSDSFTWLPRQERLLPRLKGMGHYPFTDDFTLGCGGPELGSRLDIAEMEPILPPEGYLGPREPAGEVDRVDPRVPAATFYGWATGAYDPIRCTVMVDGSGTVIGGGMVGLTRQDIAQRLVGISPSVGFAVIGPADESSRIVFISESGAMRWMPTDVTETGGRQ